MTVFGTFSEITKKSSYEAVRGVPENGVAGHRDISMVAYETPVCEGRLLSK